MAAITTVEFVHIDDNPFVARDRFVDGHTETKLDVSDEYAALPEPFVAALFQVGKQTDSARCARCNEPIGFVLADNGGFERLGWTPIGLAREVGRADVVALCELCTPLVPAVETEGTTAK